MLGFLGVSGLHLAELVVIMSMFLITMSRYEECTILSFLNQNAVPVSRAYKLHHVLST